MFRPPHSQYNCIQLEKVHACVLAQGIGLACGRLQAMQLEACSIERWSEQWFSGAAEEVRESQGRKDDLSW